MPLFANMRVFAVTIFLLLRVTAVPAPLHPTYESTKYTVANKLPGVTFPVPNSWAGNIPIGTSFGNDTLFFWLWEAENNDAKEHLIIWLNGGPGCSSMLGVFKEHGPFSSQGTQPCRSRIHIPGQNWLTFSTIVDQPVGTGFSNGNNRATNNADDTEAFLNWLSAFFKQFPTLKLNKIHILGESYAGIFVPYVANKIKQQEAKLGFKIVSIGMGDSTWTNADALTNVVSTTYIKYHQDNYGTNISQDVLTVLEKANVDCGFSSVLSQLTYPPKGKIMIPGNPENDNYRRETTPPGYDPSICDFSNGTQTPAQVAFIINGTSQDSCFGNCATFESAYNYFLDAPGRCFNAYNIDVDCNNPLYSDSAFTAYLNIPAVKAAIHAPAELPYVQCNSTLQAELTTRAQRSVPPAYFILPSLLAVGVKVQLWSGTADYILNPIGTELAIQNMSWNGAQGFQNPPRRLWYDNFHNFAGVYQVERGLGYYRFEGAGHRTAQDRPAAAFAFVEHCIVGNKDLPWG